jgi:hypothetical protein
LFAGKVEESARLVINRISVAVIIEPGPVSRGMQPESHEIAAGLAWFAVKV